MKNEENKLPQIMVEHYLERLVDQFFKILPIWESGEPSLKDFMVSLQAELLGFQELMVAIDNDPRYITLISILQYLISHDDLSSKIVKREVFKAISVCKKILEQYRILQRKEARDGLE